MSNNVLRDDTSNREIHTGLAEECLFWTSWANPDAYDMSSPLLSFSYTHHISSCKPNSIISLQTLSNSNCFITRRDLQLSFTLEQSLTE
jgi:hypothetical protein